MYRRIDRRAGTCVVVAVAISLLQSASAIAAPVPTPDRVVYPTGVFPTDLENVQAAVDLGGTVLLKQSDASGAPGTFEFGTGLRVRFQNDVTVLGETKNGRRTTVHGGGRQFSGVFVSNLPVRTAVRGIHFDHPISSAARIARSRGFEFSDNRVTNVVGAPFFELVKGQGVWVSGPVDEITGTILIARNHVEDVGGNLSYGFVLEGLDAETKIVDNVVRGMNTGGIVVGSTSQPALVEGNLVVPGPDRGLGGQPFGNGIFGDGGEGTRFVIRRNTVVCENPNADGILLSGIDAFGLPVVDAVVEKNDVTMRGSLFGGVSLYGSTSRSRVGQNRVMGDGAFALQVGAGFFEERARSNTFIGNNIAGFDSSVADVFLDSNSEDTRLSGKSGTVIDLGVNNRISGFTKRHGGLGPQSADAHGRKREAMKAQFATDKSE